MCNQTNLLTVNAVYSSNVRTKEKIKQKTLNIAKAFEAF